MALVTDQPGLVPWSSYPQFVRRHRTSIGALMGLGLLIGAVVSLQQSPTYSATASVTLALVPVYVVPSADTLAPPEVTIDTDAQLLRSPRVLGAVGAALGTDADTALDHLVVTASPNSHVLHITVDAASAPVAAAAADAAVGALLDVRRDTLGALEQTQLSQLRLLIQDQERLLAKVQGRNLVAPASATAASRVLELRTALDELEGARADPGDPLGAAMVPTDADRANTEVPLTSGAMLGLLCACAMGAVRDRLRPRAHRSETRRPLPSVRHLPAVQEDHHVV